MKEYRTNAIGFVMVWGIGLILMFLGAGDKASPKSLALGSFYYILFFGTLILLVHRYTYLHLYPDKKLKYVAMLFSRKTLDVSSITSASHHPMYRVFTFYKAVYIHYKDEKGKQRSLEVTETAYEQETIARLLKDLLEINPNIKLDSYCQKLIVKKFKK